MKIAAAVIAMLAFAAPARAEPLAYVTQQGDDSVAIVDLAQMRVVETVKVGRKPAGVAVAPGGRASMSPTGRGAASR